MDVVIHQAICGEQNKAWDLLNTTLEDNSLARKIAFQTDLQDSPPSGLQWFPNLRAFLFGEHFLLIKTYPDNSPGVRNGRVFSHCLIIEKSSLKKVTDIRSLITLFSPNVDKKIELSPIVLTQQQQGLVVLQADFELRFNKVIKNFLKFTASGSSIVWVGQQGFELALCKIWQFLTPAQKEKFNAGIHFNPNEVDQDKLSFVVIPENAASKFENKGFVLIRKDDTIELTEFSEQFLAGHTQTKKQTEEFITAIGAEEPTVEQLETISKAIPTFENFSKETNIAKLNTLANIIAAFSPDPGRGSAFKSELVSKISALLKQASDSDVLLLRNFKTQAFKRSDIELSNAVGEWCDGKLLSEKENAKNDYSEFVIKIIENPKDNWFTKLVTAKIREFFAAIDKSSANVLWRWINKSSKLLSVFWESVDKSKGAEVHVKNSMPGVLEESILSEIKLLSIKRGWLMLHATIVKSQFDFKIALTEQLKVDSNASSFEGIEILIKDVSDNEIITFTIENGDNRLIETSGKLCNHKKKLLAGINVENLNWQKIWLSAINNGNLVLDGFKKHKEIVYAFFDILVLKKLHLLPLLERISETEYTDISTYPNREKLWTVLPASLKNKYLRSTSTAVLQKLSENAEYVVPKDKDLSAYILSNGISDFLYFNRSKMKNVLPIFEAFSDIPQKMLLDYVSNYSTKVSVVEATQLGQLVLKRKYENVADVIFHKSFNDKSFKPALSECADLLGFLKYGVAVLSGAVRDYELSEDEWWKSFAELCYTLYEEGPNQNKIWIQAEGKNYDLQVNGSGKEVWISALKKLRMGQCGGAVTVKKLLKAIGEENKRNQTLKILKDLYNKL